MKIKIDFVSNSSSTGHVVAIPTDFIADKEDILRHFNSHDINDGHIPMWENPKIVQEFFLCFDILKDGNNLWYYGGEGTDLESFIRYLIYVTIITSF